MDPSRKVECYCVIAEDSERLHDLNARVHQLFELGWELWGQPFSGADAVWDSDTQRMEPFVRVYQAMVRYEAPGSLPSALRSDDPESLGVPITELEVGVRVYNRLKEAGITGSAALARWSRAQLLQLPGFGKVCLVELEDACGQDLRFALAQGKGDRANHGTIGRLRGLYA